MYSPVIAKLAILGALATHVVGSVIEARSPYMHLMQRQVSTSIPACTTECSTFENSLNVCTTTTCLCTKPVATALDNCVNCAYRNRPTTEILATANQLVNAYLNNCRASPDLPPISVTTGGAGGSATATGSGSGVGSATSSTAASNLGSSTITQTTITGNTIAPPQTQTTVGPASTTTTTTPATSGGSQTVLPGLGGNGARSLGVEGAFYPLMIASVLTLAVVVL